jgi:hypothetical protein
MEQVQITFKELAEVALSWGVKPNAIRVWRQRGIPLRYQIKLMEHFNGDAVASIARPPTLADICRERFSS